MMNKDIESVLVSEEQLDTLTTELAAKIDADYANTGRSLVMVCILKGSVMFYVDLVKKINYFAVENCMPDVTIFLDRSPAESFRATPGDDRMEQETREFHNKVYEGYKAETATSNGRIVAIKPDFDKNVTKQLIIDALKERGAIK